jgi:hypothetical protein
MRRREKTIKTTREDWISAKRKYYNINADLGLGLPVVAQDENRFGRNKTSLGNASACTTERADEYSCIKAGKTVLDIVCNDEILISDCCDGRGAGLVWYRQ